MNCSNDGTTNPLANQALSHHSNKGEGETFKTIRWWIANSSLVVMCDSRAHSTEGVHEIKQYQYNKTPPFWAHFLGIYVFKAKITGKNWCGNYSHPKECYIHPWIHEKKSTNHLIKKGVSNKSLPFWTIVFYPNVQ